MADTIAEILKYLPSQQCLNRICYS